MIDRLLEAARRRGEKTLGVLERWVKQNSYSADVDRVNAMGELLCEDFSLDALTLERHPGDGVGDHLVWRTPAWEARPADRLLLIGHHDTVFPPGSFERWEIEGDVLHGPGVLDMKGGLAVVHTALAALADEGALADLPLALISVADEEIGSRHSQALTGELAAGARAALVFEGGRAEDRIITRRKGTGAILAEVKGRAAHAGNHHDQGINAIRALARLVDAVESLTDYDAGVTVNVGLIRGGEARNTVPAHAEADIDFRFVRAEDGRRLVDEMHRVAREVAASTGAELTLEGGIRRPPLERSDASAALYQRYAACARDAGLGAEECPLIGGGSDANQVSAAGVPAIDGLGPRGRAFHTHDEQIEVSTLADKVEALVRFLAAWP